MEGIVMDNALWDYIKEGLSYLETSKLPDEVDPSFTHPDKTKGAYGFSEGAYKTVQQIYPFFKDKDFTTILKDKNLYESASKAYADWMAKNLSNELEGKSNEEAFDILHKSWNLGLSGYKKGRKTWESRILRAEEYKEKKRKEQEK